MKQSVSPSKRLRALFLALLLSCGFVFAASAPASAESSSTLTAQYPWPHNGCTGVSDYPGTANFTYACNYHDGCYGGHWASRATCDQWFYYNMMNYCGRLGFWDQPGCLAAVYPYYLGVRVLGQKYYDSAGQLSRINTPMTTG